MLSANEHYEEDEEEEDNNDAAKKRRVARRKSRLDDEGLTLEERLQKHYVAQMIKARVKELISHTKYKKSAVASAAAATTTTTNTTSATLDIIPAKDCNTTSHAKTASKYEKRDVHETVVNPLQADLFAAGDADL